MTDYDRTNLFVAAYGFIGMELVESGDIDRSWAPVKKRRPLWEEDVMKVFGLFREKVKNISKSELESRAKYANEAIERMEDSTVPVNRFLMALSLALHIVENDLDPVEKALYSGKIVRIISHATKKIGNPTIVINSRRRSHDIYLYLTGRLMIPDFIRDANARKYRKVPNGKARE